MSMNPRTTTDKIKQDYCDYISSILSVKDQEISNLARSRVEATDFVKGPYLEITLPFEDGKSLKELADEGLISNEFSKMGPSVHYEDWKLRIHQEEALRHVIEKQRNIVVSTGTGSGKTECYLYPIFDSLMREKVAGTLDAGVRALLIFPMNALANDQQKKLRKLLKNYPDITFGRYTGETSWKNSKETVEDAEKRLHEEYNSANIADNDPDLRKSIPNEFMCRDKMIETPPHILLTNYAMLEYLLLRPDTAPFFDGSLATKWHFIVIDEAHTYKGANGTEIAFLLRRLKERIRRNMTCDFRCIATSATLGDEKEKNKLADFASNLFDEDFFEDDIILTKRKHRVCPNSSRLFLPDDYKSLKDEADKLNGAERGQYLFRELSQDERIFRIYIALEDKTQPIGEIADIVFSDLDNTLREPALIDLIELAAAAKKSENETALLPARYHLFVKSLEGMFAQLYPRKQVFLDRKEKIYDIGHYCVFELANCQNCGQEFIVATTDSRSGKDFLIQVTNNIKPDYYLVYNDDNKYSEDMSSYDEDDKLIEENINNKDINTSDCQKYSLCLACGGIVQASEKHPIDCCSCVDQQKIVTVYKLSYRGKDYESNCCPCCGAVKKGLVKRFLTANQSATFAVAKSLYDVIPPRTQISVNNVEDEADDDIFGEPDIFACDYDSMNSEACSGKNDIDERGRKLLIFSDNRQEAAFFAGFFGKKYNLIMWRKTILKCLKDKSPITVIDLIDRVRDLADKTGVYSFSLESNNVMSDDEKLKMAAHYVVQEFFNPEMKNSLEGLGYVQFCPIELPIKKDNLFLCLSGSELWNLLRYMMDTLRLLNAFTYPDGIHATDDFFAPRNRAGYFRESGFEHTIDGNIFGFTPSDQSVNKRLSFIRKLLQDDSSIDITEARSYLTKLYNEIFLKLKKHGYINDSNKKSLGTVYQLNLAKWMIRRVEPTEKLFRCKTCGKIFGYSVKGLCPMMKCSGHLDEISASEVQSGSYYGKLYADDRLIPMACREHTAQLSADTAGKYQKAFENGKVNVLSCSTTFEMGVDVGELEAIFQRNVPPETSNYIQRAGRAGRRTSSAAFSVTFSRRNSHDMTFFNEPEKIIAGKISAPILDISNEKIALRHLNSIIVSWFFKKYREFFDLKTQRIVGVNDEHSCSDKIDNMARRLESCLMKKPEELLRSVRKALPNDVCDKLEVDSWKFILELVGDEGCLTRAIGARLADVESLKDIINEYKDKNRFSSCSVADKLISTLVKEPSINFLSSSGVLPKYGFPVDSVNLDIISGKPQDSDTIELSRDLKLAVSEFAPPAQLVANNKIWTSYALNVMPGKIWPAYIYYKCEKCGKLSPPQDGVVPPNCNLDDYNNVESSCFVCGGKLVPKKFIVPRFGFSTKYGDEPKTVGDNRPSTYYSTQTQFWGIGDLTQLQKSRACNCRAVGGIVDLVYSPGGRLFIVNNGSGRGFIICIRCGYCYDFIRNGSSRPKSHENKFGHKCTGELVSSALGHEFYTDILKITLPSYDACHSEHDKFVGKEQYISVLYALLEGASSALDINRSDINGCLYQNNEIVLYDDAAGGAGFVRRIYERFDKVLLEARNKVSGKCGCSEETSCYGCLRNYSNQYYHDEISRGLAYKYLDWLLRCQHKA